MIANDIIKTALENLLVIQDGQTPTATQYANGLLRLNTLLKSYTTSRNLIYDVSRETLTIPSGTQSITIGSTGTLATNRYLDIDRASLKDGNEESLLNVIDDSLYQEISNKAIVGKPCDIYYHQTWPNGTIYFNTTTDKEYQLVVSGKKRISAFADGTTDNDLPEMYELWLQAALTINWADANGAGNRITPSMVAIAERAEKVIIGQSVRLHPSRTELGGRGGYNIETD